MFPQLFGKYVLERELAAGGMAVVYLATLRGAGGFEKRLVVKQIRTELASDAAFVERFVAEAKTTVGLSHPNIVPVYELGVEQGVYFIAMELAAGLTLGDLLAAEQRLSPEEGAYLGVEICRALDYAHRKSGIVHRDVTPRNVLVDEEGAVRLIDFGIAAPATTEGGERERVFGSPGHMPIEQLRGGRLTPATDVFAVGALLLEVWSGRAPFRRATRVESDAALAEVPPPPSAADPALAPLDDLLIRAVAFDAAQRPRSAEELARPLRDFLRTADLGDIARRLGERVRKSGRKSLASIAEGVPPTPVTSSLVAGRPAMTPVTPPLGFTVRGGDLAPAAQAGTRPITQIVTETFALRDVSDWSLAALDALISEGTPPSAAVAAEPAPVAAEPAPRALPGSAGATGGAAASAPGAPAPLDPARAAGAGSQSGSARSARERDAAYSVDPSPAGASAGPGDRGDDRPASRPGRAAWAAVAIAAAAAAVTWLTVQPGAAPPVEPATPSATVAPGPVGAPGIPPAARGPGPAGGAASSQAPVSDLAIPVVGTPSASPAVAAPPGGAAAAPSLGRGPGAAPGDVPGSAAAPTAAPGDVARATSVTVVVTSDLPAQVVIDGAAAGTTPLRGLRRAAGRHTVSLTSVALGERLATTFEATSGGTVTIVGEFTRATPRLLVR